MGPSRVLKNMPPDIAAADMNSWLCTCTDSSTVSVILIACIMKTVPLDWIEQCFTSPPTQYKLYGRWFLQVKRPNQQYQSTERKSYKGKEPREHKENTKYTYAYTYKIDK